MLDRLLDAEQIATMLERGGVLLERHLAALGGDPVFDVVWHSPRPQATVAYVIGPSTGSG